MKYIRELVRELVHKHGTSNPMDLAKFENIHVEFDFYEETKGYFIKIDEIKYIVINQLLNEFLMLFVIAHELGHALMHSNNTYIMKYEKGIYHTDSHETFITNNIYEREANYFAVLLLRSYFQAYENSLPSELLEILNAYSNIKEGFDL
ncbi:ImmA/IrrE family metallo-endopeptidase [Niameybacter massiliensis]|uniref:ImmA/IrrE family metallo-endopeptidase n=1 Tax=Holtiella tumoricola TaxID=3018743 RepID=A0AA42DN00_9FIRM|nr:ImmA/IrrE family metallo-endopeptidase [Holtiella tumoricola]MDA3731623.1 ImmA/IrrE family metallo-endopeptidase [Holtiella tumoricola]